jgi:hypothetical protein
MKLRYRLMTMALLAGTTLYGQSAAEMAGRWSWSASCETGETRQGEFLLRRVSEESFRGEFLGTEHKTDIIGRGVLAVALHSFEFERHYVTAAGEEGIERWKGSVSVPEGGAAKPVWKGTMREAETECSFEATHQ